MRDRARAAALRTFETLLRPWMRLHLHAVRAAGLPGPEPPADRPLVLIANHVSWWDGFILRDLQRRLRPRAPVRAVMTERELQRHPYLRWVGAVPLEPGSPTSTLRTFRTLEAAATHRPDLSVIFFPQGGIWPSHRRPLGFHRGVEVLARRLAPAVVLPVGIHIEPLNRSAPTVFTSAAPGVAIDEHTGDAEGVLSRRLEAAVAGELDAILAFLTLHGEDAPRRWPEPHAPLPRPNGAGRAGERSTGETGRRVQGAM